MHQFIAATHITEWPTAAVITVVLYSIIRTAVLLIPMTKMRHEVRVCNDYVGFLWRVPSFYSYIHIALYPGLIASSHELAASLGATRMLITTFRCGQDQLES